MGNFLKSLAIALIFFALNASAGDFIHWASSTNLSSAETAKLNQFFDEIEAVLPEKLKNQINAFYAAKKMNSVGVQVYFDGLDGRPLLAPHCGISIDTVNLANQMKKEMKSVRSRKAIAVRYEGQIYSSLMDIRTIAIHSGFLSSILNGDAQGFGCGHKDMVRLAKASVINMIARIYDNTGLGLAPDLKVNDQVKHIQQIISEYDFYKNKDYCPQDDPTSATGSQSPPSKEGLSLAELKCADIKESDNTRVSGRLRYETVAGNWKRGKSSFMFWPRAISQYEHAGDVQDHFAYNFEYFLLDPEYACRRPVLHEFFSQHFSSGGNIFDPQAANRICKVNTELLLPRRYMSPKTDSNSADASSEKLECEAHYKLKTYNLDPDQIYDVNYFRAGAGTAMMSKFGHSMFRIVGCGGDKVSKDCMNNTDYDIILNHRANPMDLKLDNMRGLFGGYPSQLLVSPYREIKEEYGDGELRHIFTLPLGYTENGKFVEQMRPDDKKRFIYAALEEYWGYVGNYKFISNNCAEEAMKLYQISSQDLRVMNLDIKTPYAFNEKLDKLGMINQSLVKDLESKPHLFNPFAHKISTWDEYDKHRAKVESNAYTAESYKYLLEDSIKYIMELERARGFTKAAKDKQGRELAISVADVQKELADWLKLSTVSQDYTLDGTIDTQREESFYEPYMKSTFDQIEARYTRLLNAADDNQKKEITKNFYRIMVYISGKKGDDLGTHAILLAYKIANPNVRQTPQGSEAKVEETAESVAEAKADSDASKLSQKLTVDKIARIRQLVSQYMKTKSDSQPYQIASAKWGYGIPLKDEVTRGDEFVKLQEQEEKLTADIMDLMYDKVGADYYLLGKIMDFSKELKSKILLDKRGINFRVCQ